MTTPIVPVLGPHEFQRILDLRDGFEELDEASFCLGPWRTDGEIVVHEDYAVPFAEALDIWLTDLGPEDMVGELLRDHIALMVSRHEETLAARGEVPGDVLIVPTLWLHGGESDGVMAIQKTGDGPEILGLYYEQILSVDPDWQRQGLGERLVMERYLLSGDLPGWMTDDPGYSPAGHATHVAAFRTLRTALDLTLAKNHGAGVPTPVERGAKEVMLDLNDLLDNEPAP